MTQPIEVERWLPVVGYEGLYEVSDWGRVWSCPRAVRSGKRLRHIPGVLRHPVAESSGHLSVRLHREGQRCKFSVHFLVTQAFIGTRPAGLEVCHRDGDPANNHLSNLRYDTRSANIRDRRIHGVDYWLNKKACPRDHPLVKPNLVTSDTYRACLACSRARAMVYKHPELNFRTEADRYFAEIMAEAT